ncbi:hypothetical protein [Roseibium sp. RKSG952]|nr:hypothetical protein [Roseibium sp. RKSG952]
MAAVIRETETITGRPEVLDGVLGQFRLKKGEKGRYREFGGIEAKE